MPDKILPKYVNYHHGLFLSSPRFQRGLTYIQRAMYRTLCLEAPFCDTRPYLPTDDATLMLLADVPEEVWVANKDAVLKMFTQTDEGYTHPRIIKEYKSAVRAYEQRKEAGRRGGVAKAKRVLNKRLPALNSR